MRSLLVKVLLGALALWLTTRIYAGVSFAPGAGVAGVLVTSLALGIVNALVRPVLLLFALPVNLLTLGLFTLVVNGIVLELVAALTPLDIRDFGSAIIGALVLTAVAWLLDLISHRESARR